MTTEIDYNLKRLIIGPSSSELVLFKRPKQLTWFDEPSPIQVIEPKLGEKDNLANYEYCYVLEGDNYVEKLRFKPENTRIGQYSGSIKGESVFLQSLNVEEETAKKLKKKKKMREKHEGHDKMIKKYIQAVRDEYKANKIVRHSFNYIKEMSDIKYRYRIVKLEELCTVSEMTNIDARYLPILMRQHIIFGDIEALCPYCSEINYINFQEGENKEYESHLFLQHKICLKKLKKPIITMRDLNNKLVCYIVCPYEECHGEQYFQTAELEYNDEIVMSMDEYNKHLVDLHLEKGEEGNHAKCVPRVQAPATALK